ncbi:MFS transporter [Nocardia pneumoniae]|uniref:MFS transporter n=1 Tax=Nocardia pneumoniae TaxID=228601 RepID=UPI0002DED24F|nr:MFS transporter [Nocardia pneumoniae]
MLFKSIGELIPLYALYALLFADHGMSTGQISLLFAIWSATSFLLEVPSGAWADTVSRRGLLVLSGVLLTAGFALWTVVPSFPGFAAGFVLWGTSGALASGTFEALLYDDVAARGESTAYPRILGYTRAGAEAAVVVAIVAATPLYLYGGYALVGWSSVAVAALHTVIALSLPTAPKAVSAVDVDDLEDVRSESSAGGRGSQSDVTHTPVPRTGPGNPALPADAVSLADGGPADRPVDSDVMAGAGSGARAAVRDASSGTVAGGFGTSAAGDCAAPDVVVSGCASNPDLGAPGDAARDGETAVTGGGTPGTDGRVASSDMPVGRPVSGVGERHALLERPRPFERYLRMLKAGVAEAIRVRTVRYAVLLEALLFGITAFDEYFALLAQQAGVSTVVVPLLVGLTVLGSLVGSVLGGRTEGMSGRTMGIVMGIAGVLFLGGALVAGLAARRPDVMYPLTVLGFTAIGISYGIVHNAVVVAGARLQDAIEGPARATVTSVSGLLSEVVALAVFGFAAVVTIRYSMSTLLASLGIAMLAIATLASRWLPRRR